MPKGRTAWDIITGQNKPKAVEEQYANPLGVKIGASVSLRTIDYDQELFRVAEIRAWERHINNKTVPMTDYVLESGDCRVLLRAVPREDANADLKLTHRFAVLKECYRFGWSDESTGILTAANDPTGEFIIDAGTENEQKFWRQAGIVPIYSKVALISDQNRDGKVEESEVEKATMTLWDFHRTTQDEAQQDFTEFFYVELSGRFVSPTEVKGGDKTIVMLRGEEIDPRKVLAY